MENAEGQCLELPPAFLLVHGTWAKGAPWTRPDGPLARRLTMEFPGCVVIPSDWSGRNRFSDRLAAAKHVEKAATAQLDLGRPVFLIGHSHGGSAIAYAVRSNRRLQQRIAGAVFLGTPFMSFALRRSRMSIYRAAVLFWLSISFVFVGFWTGYFANPHPWRGDGTLQDFSALGAVAILLILCIWVGARLLRGQGVLKKLFARIESEAEKFDTSALLGPPTIFLRTTGDEVAMVMGFLQLLAFISNTISAITAWILAGMSAWLWRLRESFWGRSVLVALAVSLVLVVAGSGLMAKTFGFFPSSIFEFANPFSQGRAFDAFSSSFLNTTLSVAQRTGVFAIDVVAGVFALVFILFASLLITTLVVSTATFAVFGRFDPLGAFVLEMAAEPVPHGRQTLIHLPWDAHLNERAARLLGLRHSQPYSDLYALDAVCSWMHLRCMQPPASSFLVG